MFVDVPTGAAWLYPRNPGDFRVQAERCRESAQSQEDEGFRELLLDLARDYEVMAEVLEQ